MSLFGHERDISMMRHINRELMGRIIEQKCGYIKLVLNQTNSNIYGESSNRVFKDPVLLNCLIDRGDQESTSGDEGHDLNQPIQFRFYRDDLVDIQLVPEAGDIILYNENYYEVDGLVENQYFVGKYPDYAFDSTVQPFGQSVSIIVNTHLTRPEKVGLNINRL